MVEFWSDHFNINFADQRIRFFKASDDRDSIRPNAMGSFRGLLHGWDHHDNQTAVLPDILTELSNTLDAFVTDMGSNMEHITIVTMSEFGRRAWENSSGGFDHGYGSFMLALGAGVVGGEVCGEWPGLATNNLVFSDDLDITTDYRIVLAELLSKRFGQDDIATVFPDLAPAAQLGLFNS